MLSKNKLIRNCLHFINHTLWLTFRWLSSFINYPCFVISFSFFYLCSQLWDCHRFLSHSDCSAWFLERSSKCGKCTTTRNSQMTRFVSLSLSLDRFQTHECDFSFVPVPLHLCAFGPRTLRWHHSNSKYRTVQTSGRLCAPLLLLHLLFFFITTCSAFCRVQQAADTVGSCTIWLCTGKPGTAYLLSHLSGRTGGGWPDASQLRWPLAAACSRLCVIRCQLAIEHLEI